MPGDRTRRPGFLVEFGDRAIRTDGDDAERAGFFDRDRDGRDGNVGGLFVVEPGHLAHVHAVDVIGGENRDRVRLMPHDEPEVAEDRVGGAAVRSLRARQQRVHRPVGAPGAPQVLEKRIGLVLREHVDRRRDRVHEICEDEVYDTVVAREAHRELRAVSRQRAQAPAFAAGENECEDLLCQAVPAAV